MSSATRPIRLVLIWSLGTGCVADDTKDTGQSTGPGVDSDAPRPPPDTRGPWLPGTREDPITTPTGQALIVQTWYPTSSDTDGALHTYDGLLAGTALDAPAPDCTTPRPVLVFSHGNSGLRYQSIFLTEFLATRGWVVVAPDHEGNTAFDIDTARWGELALRRPVDLSQTFDWLTTELAGPGGALEGCVDPDAGFAVAGHSFGGYTAMAITSAQLDAESARACSPGWLCDEVADYLDAHPELGTPDLRDSRVWAAVPMTPAAFELLAPGLGSATVPSLVFGGTLDDITPVATQVEPIYEAIGARPKHLAILENAGHFTFSDACSILPSYPDCGGDYLDIPTAHALVTGSTTAFLEQQAGLDIDVSGWLPTDDPIVAWQTAE